MCVYSCVLWLAVLFVFLSSVFCRVRMCVRLFVLVLVCVGVYSRFVFVGCFRFLLFCCVCALLVCSVCGLSSIGYYFFL